jgi:hypothetical protein
MSLLHTVCCSRRACNSSTLSTAGAQPHASPRCPRSRAPPLPAPPLWSGPCAFCPRARLAPCCVARLVAVAERPCAPRPSDVTLVRCSGSPRVANRRTPTTTSSVVRRMEARGSPRHAGASWGDNARRRARRRAVRRWQRGVVGRVLQPVGLGRGHGREGGVRIRVGAVAHVTYIPNACLEPGRPLLGCVIVRIGA